MQRDQMLARVRHEAAWDLIVVGGGATGLGTAVDAASRGYRTLLLEGADFAKGTSSRSTKLVHGGVRYLAQGNISLVREALRERGLLMRNAPHLTRALPFVVPAYSWWARPYYGIGLKVYDLLAGSLGVGSSQLLSRGEALRRAPTLEPDRLVGGVLYYDGQFDDARLAITLARTFLDLGGVAVNYMPVTGLLRKGDRVAGVQARDLERGEEYEIQGRVVVNATGVFTDTIRRMDNPDAAPLLAVSQGVHLVLSRDFLPGDHAIMIPRTEDGRVLFAIPWHDRVVVGTTDTPRDSIPLEPRPLPQEIDFLLRHARLYLSVDPTPSDVLSVFAGLRPLVRAATGTSTSALSRDHTLVVAPSGLVTITGGKWTTYRKMGEDAVTRAAEIGGLPERPSPTAALKLHGWRDNTSDGHLAVYGADLPEVRQLLAERPEWARPLHPNLPYLAAEVIWAARRELARTVEDVLARRTRALLLDALASQEAAPLVARLLAGELGRDATWEQAQVEEYRQLAAEYALADTRRTACA